MMKTPIVDFVKDYVNQKNLRLHMPGHKGKEILGFEAFDITEIEGADVLYKAEGIIKQSEENAKKVFGTKKTLYSAEGSSLSIRAMLYLAKAYAENAGKKPLIAAGRNAHQTFVNACALLGLEVDWLREERATLISCNITPVFLEEYLAKSPQKPIAVYVTSPDYLGNMLDIEGLSKICKKYGVLLMVDNAHGAYLKFLPKNIHPIALGADICCDSAHKTLPVLTGGAYLHIGKNAPEMFCLEAQKAMSLFASTSPSYLILQSLDMANKYLSERFSYELALFLEDVKNLKAELQKFGFELYGNEPLKITVASKSFGYKGFELAKLLFEKGIVCEFSDPDFVVMMLSAEIGKEGLEVLGQALLSIEKREAITEKPPVIAVLEKKLSLKEAIFSPSTELDIEECLGRVLANAKVSCPPAVPIVVCGEEITHEAINCFKYYGIEKCSVVKKVQ